MGTMRKEIKWWECLSENKKLIFEYQVFGRQEYYEDNTLTENDIIKIYNKVKTT